MATFSLAEVTESLWHPDSAAATHIIPEEGILSCLTPCTSSDMVQVGNCSMLPIANISSLCINTHARPLTLKSILHVP